MFEKIWKWWREFIEEIEQNGGKGKDVDMTCDKTYPWSYFPRLTLDRGLSHDYRLSSSIIVLPRRMAFAPCFSMIASMAARAGVTMKARDLSITICIGL